VTGLLGNIEAVTFRRLVEDLTTLYKKLGSNISLEMHFLHSHLDSLLLNCGAVTNTVSIFTRTSQQWRTNTMANGVLPY
jgi:hypothetical protein